MPVDMGGAMGAIADDAAGGKDKGKDKGKASAKGKAKAKAKSKAGGDDAEVEEDPPLQQVMTVDVMY